MKKISLKSIKTEELLSRDELKQIMGGFRDNGGSGGGCPTPCRGGIGYPCVTTDCKAGTCQMYMGIYGCVV